MSVILSSINNTHTDNNDIKSNSNACYSVVSPSLYEQKERVNVVPLEEDGIVATPLSEERREDIYLTILRLTLWRIIATSTSILVAFILTNDISKALSIGIIDNLIKMIIQFFYERIWIYFLKGETESKKVTWIRVIIWRIIGICLTLIIAQIITNNMNEAIIIVILDHTTKIILHFIFERTWIFFVHKSKSKSINK